MNLKAMAAQQERILRELKRESEKRDRVEEEEAGASSSDPKKQRLENDEEVPDECHVYSLTEKCDREVSSLLNYTIEGCFDELEKQINQPIPTDCRVRICKFADLWVKEIDMSNSNRSSFVEAAKYLSRNEIGKACAIFTQLHRSAKDKQLNLEDVFYTFLDMAMNKDLKQEVNDARMKTILLASKQQPTTPIENSNIFDKLPTELVEKIFAHTADDKDTSALRNLSQVCLRFNSIVSRDVVWRNAIDGYYDDSKVKFLGLSLKEKAIHLPRVRFNGVYLGEQGKRFAIKFFADGTLRFKVNFSRQRQAYSVDEEKYSQEKTNGTWKMNDDFIKFTVGKKAPIGRVMQAIDPEFAAERDLHWHFMIHEDRHPLRRFFGLIPNAEDPVSLTGHIRISAERRQTLRGDGRMALFVSRFPVLHETLYFNSFGH
ncbi:unnamed protein product [Caenorhabditis bovis]|uniref:F-box domain-containing protein n=1 Tax=Caenorhabditis bovis TaxID=2654633 RepID=A0A8S1FE68_9PELO|nr:unnamed protein product [Caenorhabditis bovis]